MAAKKQATKKQAPPREPTLRERATQVYQRISTALNPRTYAGKPAQDAMQGWNEDYGAGARRRYIEQQVNENGKTPPRNNQRRR